MLDAILMPEWEHRYFSFNGAWAPGKRMASMRNGSGDDRFTCFSADGVFFKAFWHAYAREDPERVFAGLPERLTPELAEPAFSNDRVTFGGWHDGGTWTLRGNAEPVADDLAILGGDPARYREYAAEYFEVDVPLDVIAHVLAVRPLDAGRSCGASAPSARSTISQTISQRSVTRGPRDGSAIQLPAGS